MFRFENLTVWQKAVDITMNIFTVADELESSHMYRFAEQLRSSALSISNNIAEGSGSASRKEFRQFLNIAHRSLFETVNMLMICRRQGYGVHETLDEYIAELEEVSRMIVGFSKSLR
jgi:four helix bundle protein